MFSYPTYDAYAPMKFDNIPAPINFHDTILSLILL